MWLKVVCVYYIGGVSACFGFQQDTERLLNHLVPFEIKNFKGWHFCKIKSWRLTDKATCMYCDEQMWCFFVAIITHDMFLISHCCFLCIILIGKWSTAPDKTHRNTQIPITGDNSHISTYPNEFLIFTSMWRVYKMY